MKSFNIRILRGSDEKLGPRIAMAYNEEYHDFLLEHGRAPGLRAYSNTGVFLIKPGHIRLQIFKITINIFTLYRHRRVLVPG